MESKTYLKNLKISPKKLRFYLPAVKKMKPIESVDYLFYVATKPAKILYFAIKSAMSNAKNYLKVNEDVLNFKLFTIEEGQRLKRSRPGSRGTAKPIIRRMSHIKIILEAEKVKDKAKNEIKELKSKVKIKK